MDNEKTETNPARETLVIFWKSVRRIVSDLDIDESKWTEEHESLIRRHYDQLICSINVPEVITQMFKSGKLSAKEHEHLRQFQSTPIRASEELLHIIIINPQDVYECFLESLKKAKQHNLYQMLTSEEESLCVGEQFVSEHSRVIRQNYDWLTEKLDPDSGLLATLYSKEVLSQREYSQIFFEKDTFKKNEELLSTISRKTAEDFNKFIVTLNEASQVHVTKRLIETLTGEAYEIVLPKKEKILPTVCSNNLEEKIPPKPLPRLKKPTALPSNKPEVNKLEPFTKKKRQSEKVEAKFQMLPNELQTEVSTKVFLTSKSTDNIWKVTLTNMLEDSRNIKRKVLTEAKAANEKYARRFQEINLRERECAILKEDIQREKTNTKTQLRQLKGRVNALEEKLNFTENENRQLFVKLKNSEVQVESKKEALKIRQTQEAKKKSVSVEKHYGQVAYSQMETELKNTRERLMEKDQALEVTTTKLEETQEMLTETKAKVDDLTVLQLLVRDKCIDYYLEVLNQRKECGVNEELSIIQKLKDQVTHYERELQEAKVQLEDTNGKLQEATEKFQEIQKKFKDTQWRR